MQTTTHSSITKHTDAMTFLAGRDLAIVRSGFRYALFRKVNGEVVGQAIAVAIRDGEGLHVSGDLPDKTDPETTEPPDESEG